MNALYTYIRLWHDVVWCAIAKYYPQSYSMGVKSKLYTKREKSTLYSVICEYVFDSIHSVVEGCSAFGYIKRKKLVAKKKTKKTEVHIENNVPTFVMAWMSVKSVAH